MDHKFSAFASDRQEDLSRRSLRKPCISSQLCKKRLPYKELFLWISKAVYQTHFTKVRTWLLVTIICMNTFKTFQIDHYWISISMQYQEIICSTFWMYSTCPTCNLSSGMYNLNKNYNIRCGRNWKGYVSPTQQICNSSGRAQPLAQVNGDISVHSSYS